jgi:hypothetical protein
MADEEIDWSLTTFEGNRCRQHQEFRALSFRDKLIRIEQMGIVVAHFQSLRAARLEMKPSSPGEAQRPV